QSSIVGVGFELENAFMEFGPGFGVEKIRGHRIAVHEFSADTVGGITALDLEYVFPPRFELFDFATLIDGSVSFGAAANGKDIVLDLSGGLELPDSVGSVRIDVEELSI